MIYILEFSTPLGGEKRQARYYIGSCRDDLLDERLQAHRNGSGAAITRAAAQRGYHIELIFTLPGGRTEERRLKNQKNAPRIVARLKQGKSYDYLNCGL